MLQLLLLIPLIGSFILLLIPEGDNVNNFKIKNIYIIQIKIYIIKLEKLKGNKNLINLLVINSIILLFQLI